MRTWSGIRLRVGLFGGTFDPIHLGHMAVAEGTMDYLSLDEVVFVPAGRPWMKEGTYLSDSWHRQRMVELAVSGKARFSVTDREVVREGLTYTVDTLREIEAESDGSDEIYLLLGTDAYDSFELWREPAEILRMSILAVASRPGGPPPTFGKLDLICPDGSCRAIAVPVKQVDVSSSDIRNRVSLGESISGQVPSAVERYIHQHGFYEELGGLK